MEVIKYAKRSIAEDQTILDDFIKPPFYLHYDGILHTTLVFHKWKKSYIFIFISAIKRDSNRVVKSMKMGGGVVT